MYYLAKKDDGAVAVFLIQEGDIEKILEAHSGEHTFLSYRQISQELIPQDRTFRDAWRDELEGEQIDICMNSAKEIALRILRYERDKELEKLDKQTVIALGKGDEIARQDIEMKKQILRDATESLKGIQVSGHNDVEALNRLKQLSTL